MVKKISKVRFFNKELALFIGILLAYLLAVRMSGPESAAIVALLGIAGLYIFFALFDQIQFITSAGAFANVSRAIASSLYIFQLGLMLYFVGVHMIFGQLLKIRIFPDIGAFTYLDLALVSYLVARFFRRYDSVYANTEEGEQYMVGVVIIFMFIAGMFFILGMDR